MGNVQTIDLLLRNAALHYDALCARACSGADVPVVLHVPYTRYTCDAAALLSHVIPLQAPIHSHLDNSLQLSSIPESVLDDHPAELLLLLTTGRSILFGCDGGRRRCGRCGDGREVDVAVANVPPAMPCKLEHGTLGVEEQQRLGAAQRQRRIRPFAGRGDLAADLRRKDLRLWLVISRTYRGFEGRALGSLDVWAGRVG